MTVNRKRKTIGEIVIILIKGKKSQIRQALAYKRAYSIAKSKKSDLTYPGLCINCRIKSQGARKRKKRPHKFY